MGYGDCDGNLNNGCESDTSKDMANCGGCGMLCNTKNTKSAVCAGSVCTIVCNPGYSDCDMDPATGCESKLSNDPKNCGACGNVCPMNLPGCQKGMCSAQVCGNDCWSQDGCLTANGHCIRFTCRDGSANQNFCNGCMGWNEISYEQWMNNGYCADVIATYRMTNGNQTKCGGPPACCQDANACAGFDNAWHFWSTNSNQNYYTGPCLGCGDANCTYWNYTYNGSYTRLSVCER
jgi:hypothetical protein